MEYIKYKAYLGFDELKDSDDLLNSMSILIDSVEYDNIESTFDVITEYRNRTPFFYAVVNIPKWSESLLFIRFPEYNWECC